MTYYERRVEYYETDKMGVVWHGNYLRWFEEARTFQMRSLGLSYKDMEDMGIMMPVISVDCKYKRGAQYGEIAIVEAKTVFFNGIKMRFEYIVRDKATGDIFVTGSSDHCFVDNDFRPMNLKKTHNKLYNDILKWIDEGN